MPESFKKEYPNTRIIIDATEFAVERPSSLLSQACTFSSYKNKNTVKVLIGVTPSGAISFVSEAYEGSISDRKLIEASGLLDNLESGDEVMADKGFKIQDLLTPRGIRLNIPPFLQTKIQMTANDVFLTKKIARLRVHVERSIGRVKEFKIFHDTLPASMWDCISNVILCLVTLDLHWSVSSTCIVSCDCNLLYLIQVHLLILLRYIILIKIMIHNDLYHCI